MSLPAGGRALRSAVPDKINGPSLNRSYKACSGCRARKIRCIVENRSQDTKCNQCKKDGSQCVYETKSKTYDTSSRIRKSQQKRARIEAVPTSTEGSPNESTEEQLNVRSSADALLFLSEAATRHLEGTESPASSNPISQSKNDFFQSEPEARNITLVHEIPIEGVVASTRASAFPQVSPWDNPEIQQKVAGFRCRLFWENILLPHEAMDFVFHFFHKQYPFFPFIPQTYYTSVLSYVPDIESIRTLFEEDEILLGCIIAVSSRYYHLPTQAIGGYERSCEIHNRAWTWTRDQVSRVILEGTRPRALLSVVETLLMFAEWLPRSIHASIDNTERLVPQDGRVIAPRNLVSEQILQPAFRTDHVSWFYVGNAFLLLRSLPPDRRKCSVLHTTNRYLVLLFICIVMSQSLGRRLGRSPLMTFDEVDMKQISQAFMDRNEALLNWKSNPLNAGELSLGATEKFHEAFVGLLKLLNRAQEVLHPPSGDGIIEAKTHIPDGSPQMVALMRHFDNLNQEWASEYSGLLDVTAPGMSHFSQHMLRIDFEYLRLYEFSISLGVCIKQRRNESHVSGRPSGTGSARSGNDWEFDPDTPAYYLEQAIDAAEKLLRLMISFKSSAANKALRYASSRHYMKIVFAAAFLIQAIRAGIPSIEYQDRINSTLKETIVNLETCSIDNAHPAFRYSILLRGLMGETERRKLKDASSPFSLIIGPRRPNQLSESIDMNQSNSDEELRQFQTDGYGDNSEGNISVSHYIMDEGLGGVSEGGQGLVTGDLGGTWEECLTFMDSDTFLQSLIGVDLFNN